MSRPMNDQRSRRPERPANDPLRIWESFRDPMLRWGDVPGSKLLAEQFLQHPEDRYLAELAGIVANEQAMRAMQADDPFYPNPPPARSFLPPAPGVIPIAALSTGDVLSIATAALCKNLLVVGPTGGGKTNFLRILIAAVLEEVP